jgi:palmitoyltransferase ZDHHC9/14/18
MTSPSNSEALGLSLPSRRNVTVTRRLSVHSDEDDDAVAPLSRNSLEGTRRYYNIDGGLGGGASPARARKISSTTSPRPLSNTPSEASVGAALRSPTRGGAVPLPTPRGFLAPQKPAAARRLEQRERNTSVSTTGRASTDVRPSADYRPWVDTFRRPSPRPSADFRPSFDASIGPPTGGAATPNMSEYSHDSRATGVTGASFHTAASGMSGATFHTAATAGSPQVPFTSSFGPPSISRGPSPAPGPLSAQQPQFGNQLQRGSRPQTAPRAEREVPTFGTGAASANRPSTANVASIQSGTETPRRQPTFTIARDTETETIPEPPSASHPQPLPGTPSRPSGTDSGHGEGVWDRQTDASSPSRGHGASLHHDLSSDYLVDTLGVMGEKRLSQRRASPAKGSKSPSLVQQAMVETNQRRYTEFENKNSTFFCSGRLMTGGDTPLSFILSIILLLGVSGLWVGTTGVWLWQNAHEYGMARGAGIAITVVFVYLFGLTTSSMAAASFREPGILPRDLDTDPPYTPVDIYWEANPREILVGKDGKDKVQCKYCETCKSYRPPRCSHCRLCGNCVEGIDHHCAYLHGCVGRRNYFAFLVFVISTAVSDIYVVVFSALHFSMLCAHDGISFKQALEESPGAAVSFGLGILTLAPVLFLLWYHIRLLLYNLTTIEQIRASASSNLFRATQRPYNPFAAPTRVQNIIRASIGRPQVPSWINAAGFVVQDNRRVNPALTTPEKYLELV